MADFFKQLSNFWNTVMEGISRLISAFDTEGGSIFGKIKDMIAEMLGKAADETAAQEEAE